MSEDPGLIRCQNGTCEEFQAAMRALMALQPPMELSLFRLNGRSARFTQLLQVTVEIQARFKADGKRAKPAKLVRTGKLSPDHTVIANRILGWFQPAAKTVSYLADGRKIERPGLIHFLPREERSGHEQLAAAELLIDFLVRTGAPREEAARLVSG